MFHKHSFNRQQCNSVPTNIILILQMTFRSLWFPFIMHLVYLVVSCYCFENPICVRWETHSLPEDRILALFRLTLSQMTNFRLFQNETVCRQQLQICWKWHKVLQNGRKHCGKRRNCSLWAISPFPTVFSRDMYCRHVKTRACLGKG